MVEFTFISVTVRRHHPLRNRSLNGIDFLLRDIIIRYDNFKRFIYLFQ